MNIDMERYIRQLMIPYFGEEAQEKLLSSKVLIVGAGGLGSPVIMYLSSAGVGELTIVDFDAVEKTNLQRQVIHAGKIGWNKAESAMEFVSKLNPDVYVRTLKEKIEPGNVMDIINGHDLVVSCPDNFRTRFLLNDACRIKGIPLIHGAIFEFEGEAMTITDSSPCYRCLYPEAYPEKTPGIIGATAGVIGSIQAVEAIKVLTGLGDLLDCLLRVDLLSMELFKIEIKRRDDCPICNGRLRQIYPENYEDSCRIVTY
ncbi:Dinucleotide-utilizing enzymes involved in molybdopterin and thiamine biosynthesis family 2 [Archaeoglobus sulfaticallidus PM70-1]|uniref:Dinucleotide-utilizing enzymes involved in molybdopterin and thiamine biosynthesis family 2 n=2 Tax=Archaeoglobus TaxID=2233 RepID=N0BBR6_9EURY|nr:Dinucleotide-utilizing enzymes involved in molybdopterin and thiamine biosynthesis family 2 [Archaeoglobus sulfaticallidus PM70-1]